jgi:hypothetical protein
MAALSTATTVYARPEYVAPTGASGCTDCHLNNYGQGFQSGVISAASGGIAGLTAFIQSLNSPDTKPRLSPINVKWNVTVGETPLSIPFVVSDAENDTFSVNGSVAAGMQVSTITTNAAGLPTFNLTWKPTAAQAGGNYSISIYAKETGAGRILSSVPVTANVKVWAARANAATAKVKQFTLQSARWSNNSLKLTGQVLFKPSVTAAQRTAALANLRMNVTSQTGMVIGMPLAVAPTLTGNWTKSLKLSNSQVPCTVVVNYEGLKAEYPVNLAPAATCVR